jgi:hypothetical protein
LEERVASILRSSVEVLELCANEGGALARLDVKKLDDLVDVAWREQDELIMSSQSMDLSDAQI